MRKSVHRTMGLVFGSPNGGRLSERKSFGPVRVTLVGEAVPASRVRNAAAATAGFTLIELLIAMVLLAVGLLGVAGLGIGAARSVTLAERNSRAALIAQEHMDRAVQQIYQNISPVSCTNQDVGGGNRLTRTVVISATPNLTPHTITVTVTPPSPGSTPRPYTIRSDVYDPRLTALSQAGSC